MFQQTSQQMWLVCRYKSLLHVIMNMLKVNIKDIVGVSWNSFGVFINFEAIQPCKYLPV